MTNESSDDGGKSLLRIVELSLFISTVCAKVTLSEGTVQEVEGSRG